jgi:hypothetical protein
MSIKTLSPENDTIDYFNHIDSLANFREVNYSVFSRYFCTAGCKICYVTDAMKDAKDNHTVSSNIEDELNNLSEIFDIVSSSDDLLYIKNTLPNVYAELQRVSPKLAFGGMTDNQWIKVGRLLKEFNFTHIEESSFTDIFFCSCKNTLVDIIEELLLQYNIRQIKIISTDDDLTNIAVSTLTAMGLNIHTQKEITKFQDNVPVLRDEILNNSMYSSNSKIFVSLLDNIEFKALMNYNSIEDLIIVLLKRKQQYYAGLTQNKYAIKISMSLVVNEDFNFIPSWCFKYASKLKNHLLSLNYVEVEGYGLIKNNTTIVIPLYTWKELS